MSRSDESYQERTKITWGPAEAILGTIAVYFLGQLIAGILLALYPIIKGWDADTAGAWIGSSAGAVFAFYALASAATLGLIVWFLHSRQAHPHDIGLKRPRLGDLGYVFLGFGAYFLLFTIVFSLLPFIAPGINLEQRQELGFSTDVTGLALLFAFISLVILPSIVEEIVCRGFLYTGLRARFSFIHAALITSVIFAAAHLQFGSGNPLLWVAAIDTFLLSLVLVCLREKTGSLWAPIGLHAVKNGLTFSFLFVLPKIFPNLPGLG